MKIAFISTRGIPNNYGGFEQFAEYISIGLVSRGHEVVVYTPHFHPYKDEEFKGVKIKRIYSPELWLGGSIGSFFYDFFSLRDAIKNENFDIIYEAGYTSIIPAFIWFNIKKFKKSIVITNMDGLEYKRTKFNPLVQKFVFWEEKQAVKHSHYLISDNLGIQEYYKEKYNRDSKFLAYGAKVVEDFSIEDLNEYNLQLDNYYLIIARLEPENNIETVIQGYIQIHKKLFKPLVIIGKLNTKHGKYLYKKYSEYQNVIFLDGIYDFDKLNSLRYYSSFYFHGHSVGGTNPSLLEAMASKSFIVAHDNIFNKSVLKDNAIYFNNSEDVSSILLDEVNLTTKVKSAFLEENLKEISSKYSWDNLVIEHEEYFDEILNEKITL